MALLVLSNIDPETTEKLERRAKRLGTTPEEEASRLLRERLRSEPSPDVAVADDANEATPDPRFKRSQGFLVFMGAVAPEVIPDHRALREDRVDSLLGGVGEGRL